jgi:hypothetical protein
MHPQEACFINVAYSYQVIKWYKLKRLLGVEKALRQMLKKCKLVA